MTLQTDDKEAALLLARKRRADHPAGSQTSRTGSGRVLDCRRPGIQQQFFMFGPRDLYRPGETIILNALLRDGDGKPLAEQPVKFDDGSAGRSGDPLAGQQTGQWSVSVTWRLIAGRRPVCGICASTGDNQPREWDFHVEDFMPERMALNLTPQNTPLAMDYDVHFNVAGAYLYGAPASGNQLRGKTVPASAARCGCSAAGLPVW